VDIERGTCEYVDGPLETGCGYAVCGKQKNPREEGVLNAGYMVG